jgi:preprotein translocase subunit SecF
MTGANKLRMRKTVLTGFVSAWIGCSFVGCVIEHKPFFSTVVFGLLFAAWTSIVMAFALWLRFRSGKPAI